MKRDTVQKLRRLAADQGATEHERRVASMKADEIETRMLTEHLSGAAQAFDEMAVAMGDLSRVWAESMTGTRWADAIRVHVTPVRFDQ